MLSCYHQMHQETVLADQINELVHTFAGNPLDRAEALRRDETALLEMRRHPGALFLPFNNLRVGVKTAADNSQQLNWITPNSLDPAACEEVIFLGLDNGQPRFAVALTTTESGDFADCRMLAGQLPVADSGILAQARAQLDWHKRNPFCAQCGTTTHPARGGQIRRCDRCDKHTFPRTDPVAIMLIIDKPGGDRCLLGRPHGRIAINNFYTALAGFLDQGESLEEAVRREVWEEAGIRVGHVHYHSSQPWPFPSQLMIGCHGIAATQDINFDTVEMADVRWFNKAEVARAVAEENSELRIPGNLAIAHHLIRTWIEGDVEL